MRGTKILPFRFIYDTERLNYMTMENHDFAFTFLTCMVMVVTVVTSFFVRKEMRI